MCLLKHDDNGLNFDFMYYFHMKMSLFGLCTLFSKVTLFSLPEVFLGLKYAKKCVGGRSSAWTALGELTTLPQSP